MPPALVFVYNADSGLFNTVTDIAHKIFSPGTYGCNLCAITYGTFSIREEWQEFLESLNVPLEFLHRDEFGTQADLQQLRLPAIFRRSDAGLALFVSAEEINGCTSVADLKSLIREKLA